MNLSEGDRVAIFARLAADIVPPAEPSTAVAPLDPIRPTTASDPE
jgi:hypothetical protein